MARRKRKWFSVLTVRELRSKAWSILTMMLAVLFCGVCCNNADARQDATERYDAAMAKWQECYVEALTTYSEFKVCEESESEALQERYLELKAKGELLAGNTVLAAADCVQEATTANPELMDFLQPIPQQYYDGEKYAQSARVGRALRKHRVSDFPLMFNTLRSAYFANEFDYAGELFDEILSKPDWLSRDGKMPSELDVLYQTHPELKELWTKEQKLREMEAVKDHLPRIQFETTKGNIVVELFNDQYPQFVKNIFSLIESNHEPFFVDMSFFFCMKHQCAITGSKSEDGNQLYPLGGISPDTIRATRGNFHGSFSLDINVQDGAPVVSTACRFVLIPSPEFNGSTLVLGRVIEGMDVVAKLENTHEFDDNLQIKPIEAVLPDRLVQVTVIRKPQEESAE